MWWLLPDSNWGHKALQASALPTELKSHIRVANPVILQINGRFYNLVRWAASITYSYMHNQFAII